MARCPDCPAAGRCVAEWTRHAAYCDWARAGGRPRERVRELSDSGAPAAVPALRLAIVAGPVPAVAVDYGTGAVPRGPCCR